MIGITQLWQQPLTYFKKLFGFDCNAIFPGTLSYVFNNVTK